MRLEFRLALYPNARILVADESRVTLLCRL
jgi:hypothetical protein